METTLESAKQFAIRVLAECLYFITLPLLYLVKQSDKALRYLIPDNEKFYLLPGPLEYEVADVVQVTLAYKQFRGTVRLEGFKDSESRLLRDTQNTLSEILTDALSQHNETSSHEAVAEQERQNLNRMFANKVDNVEADDEI